MIGAKGIPPEQTALREGALRAVAQSEAFRRIAEKNQWDAELPRRGILDAQYGGLNSVMVFRGLAK